MTEQDGPTMQGEELTADDERCPGTTRDGHPCELYRFGGVPHCGPCARVADGRLCPDCGHRKDEHERPYGCANCACDNGYWSDEEEEPA